MLFVLRFFLFRLIKLVLIAFLIISIIGEFISNTYANNTYEVLNITNSERQENLNFAKSLEAKTSKFTMQGIWQEWLKLQNMPLFRNKVKEENIDLDQIANGKTFVKIFVSTSMNKALLKAYLDEAKLYQGVLIFNGLPDGSWRQFARLVDQLEVDGNNAPIQIDDLAFDEYGVREVPTIILTKEGAIRELFEGDNLSGRSFDKVSGNIGVKRALELFAEEGELASMANKLLMRQ